MTDVLIKTPARTARPRHRDQLARAYGSNIAMNALLGSERAVNTVVGWADWRFAGILSVLGSIWGLLTSTRHIRGDEEAGRRELLLAGQTTRGRAGAQAIAGLGAGLLAMFVLTVAYALRMVADSDPGLHGLVWLSPLGWLEESRPLTHPHPMALLPVLVLPIAVIAMTLFGGLLLYRRDIKNA